ncbi:hypoxia induced protein [Hirsutella rhossiliensis]|uniref:Hypoxia induced protein n=1 Tax=Hirsutella rhossiliensis TaxID=111463 RepID=A0A9P8MVT1_9HYPO|nr:hypoxia induced protein [Hirsutella rhossiliensis]KAH0962185.1 hypoxia induced protein [Hirsutella rhossiliensis]
MADRPPPPPLLSGSMPSSFDGNQDFYNERPMQKVTRKLKEEPLVPLGICLTVFAFVNAYRALRRGDSQQANKMFRARVAAQGFTVVAMVAGSMYYSKDREKTKELQKLKEQRDAEEKRIKWIRELEVRDEEDKALKARLEQRRQKPLPSSNAETTPEETARPGTGGALGKMGLWPRGENGAQEESAPVDAKATEETTPKKQNPKSSLGAIGEVIASNKKDEGGSKPAAEIRPEKREP